MFKEKLKAMRNRKAEMSMLHVGFGSHFWHPYDILFVLTGWVIG